MIFTSVKQIDWLLEMTNLTPDVRFRVRFRARKLFDRSENGYYYQTLDREQLRRYARRLIEDKSEVLLVDKEGRRLEP